MAPETAARAFGCAIAFFAIALSTGARAVESPERVLRGTWNAAIDADQPSGFTVMLSLGPGDAIEERVTARDGTSYELYGRYSFARAVLHYRWTDYAPHAAGAPDEAGSSGDVAIRIRDANHFVGRGPDGRTVYWSRAVRFVPALPPGPSTST